MFVDSLTPSGSRLILIPGSGGGARNALTPGYCLSRLWREEVNCSLTAFCLCLFRSRLFPARLAGLAVSACLLVLPRLVTGV